MAKSSPRLDRRSFLWVASLGDLRESIINLG
jgi:hypothetical protein